MKQLINDDWYFAKLSCGSSYEEAMKAEFSPVTLPHDWLIGQKDLYESADAWYRKTLDFPKDPEEVVMLRFDGVYMDCDILLNGEVICTHPYGYTAFDVILSGKLRRGANTVYVHIRHQSPNSRWYSGSGIYRDVYLVELPENHLVPDGLSLRVEQTEKGWRLEVNAETAGPDSLPFFCELSDADGNVVCTAYGTKTEEAVQAVLQIDHARHWSPEDPYLYTLTSYYGKQTEVRKIGLRSVLLDPARGLLLNGNPVRLRGVCLHHDLGALGSAFHEKAARRQLALMKEMGANAIRTSHNPPASVFLDLCDELGFLVADEAFDMWERSKTEYDYARFFPAWASSDVASWIRRDRCHPCVVLWSIGNEIYDIHADERGAEITRFLADTVRLHDPDYHAYITFGCNYMAWEGGQRCAGFVDAVGYNYGENLYERHHAEHPDWFIFGSETGSILSSRGVYHFPMEQIILSDDDEQCSALGNSNTSWGAESLLKMILDDLYHPFSLGQFVWSGIDYIGEPTPYHTRSSYFGQADTACFPKDSFYLFQCFWSNRHVTHLGVCWDWNPGQMIDVPVVSNGFETELFLNGCSLGRKITGYGCAQYELPVWKIPFSPGELRAVSYDANGRILGEDIRYTPGETDQFILTAEDPFLLADGKDLAFVCVQAVDQNLHPVPNARDRVSIEILGGGELAGTDNGDSTDPDSYRSSCRRLFNGKLLIIVRSNGKKIPVRIRLYSGSGIFHETVIPVLPSEINDTSAALPAISPSHEPLRIPVRRIVLQSPGRTMLDPEHPECAFLYRILPENADHQEITWQVTNHAAVPALRASCKVSGDTVIVRAESDGHYFLRALSGERPDKANIISQIEFDATGFGARPFDAYTYIPASLYDDSEGKIGAGNEKGISFAIDHDSMVIYRQVDFGDAGSDSLYADIFALNDDLYCIDLLTGNPGCEPRLLATLSYRKPSIWNVYQRENWRLPKRLTGIQTVCLRAHAKFHLKGFGFVSFADSQAEQKGL